MKILSFILILGTAMLPNVALCEIKTVNTMDEIHTVFITNQMETLGIFDIDMVLRQPKEPTFQMANIKNHKVIFKKLFADLTPVEKNITLNLVTDGTPSILIEPLAPQIIQAIQKISPNTIALTAALTGPLDKISDLTIKRYETLKSLGIDFSNSFLKNQMLVFSTMEPFKENYPEFKKGILSANGEQDNINKGTILIEFLKRTNTHPECIIFVDDKESNVTEVGTTLAIYNPKINYIGIIYKGAELFPSEIVTEIVFENAWLQKIRLAKKISNQFSKKIVE